MRIGKKTGRPTRTGDGEFLVLGRHADCLGALPSPSTGARPVPPRPRRAVADDVLPVRP